MSRLSKGLLISLLGLVSLMAISLIAWVSTSHSASTEAQEALEKADVDNGSWYAFGPDDHSASSVGVILYPGAHVSADAYALLAQQLAKESGALVVVARVPLDLAFLNQDAAGDVIEAYPDVERWVVGGHSLGGAMAASFAEANPSVNGLLLWASRPSRDIDLSHKEIEVTSIHGSEDRLIESASIAEARTRLPSSAVYVEIEGANHYYFGDYGEQSDDGEPTISREEARAEIVRVSSDLIQRVRSRG
jgi:pimeloyl-ACP methyl ester carboxylesterase